MSHFDWDRVIDVSGLESVNGDAVFLGADLDCEILVGPPEDFIGAVVRGLERRLLVVLAHENELGFAQAVRNVGLDLTVCASRNRSKVTDSLSLLL